MSKLIERYSKILYFRFQVEIIVERRPNMAICHLGYRGKRKIGVTSIEIPDPSRQTKTASSKRHARAIPKPRNHRADYRPSQEREQDAAQLPQKPIQCLHEPAHGLYCDQFAEVHPNYALFVHQTPWAHTSTQCSACTDQYLA